jgi:2-polyprenyl-3-methyl-5-hydroxy-6-metoxy-1,4-benzoquinol methylase
MILESTMVAKDDFISKIIGTMHDNCDVGTVSPLFDNHAYFRMFGATVDEHMREQPRLRSLKVYDSITTLPYALYIRWGLWEKTGGFCAEYTSLYATVVDFQLRALKSGYRNVISLDAFMEVSSKMPIEVISGHDTEVMQRRWGVHYTNNTIGNNYLINMIERLETKPSNILEVGCDMGENLIMLKNLYPDASLYGIELNGNAVEIAKTFANVVQGNIETDIIPFKAVKFDFIIFGDVLEHLRNPEETVRMCREYLTENGRIVSSIPNVQHISILNNLLKGRFPYAEQGLLDKTHIHLFTGYEIMQMFAKTGYTIEEMIFTIYPISAEEQNTLDKLKANFPYTDEKSMKAFQYITCAKKI